MVLAQLMRDRQIFCTRALVYQVCDYQIANIKEILKSLFNTVNAV